MPGATEAPTGDTVLRLANAMADPAHRPAAAAALAAHWGAQAVLVLIRDPELDVLLPAPGFPRTLPGGPTWRDLIARCRRAREVDGMVGYPDAATLTPARALVDADGSVLVLIGGRPALDAADLERIGFPLLSALLRAEAKLETSAALVAETRHATARASALAGALDVARSENAAKAADLARALDEAAGLNDALRRHEEQLRATARHLEILNRIGGLISAELDFERLVQVVTDAATELTGAEFGALFYNRRDEQGDTYTLHTLSGAPREAFAAFPLPRSTGVFAPTFRGEGIIRSDDITRDPRYGRNPPHKGMPAGHLPVRSYLAVPVISRSGDVLGGLFLGHGQPGVFDAHAEMLAAGIAAQAAIAIDNARLYEEAQAEIKERREVEAALRQSEDRFRTLANLAPAFVWFGAPDGGVQYLNDRWYAYTGQTPDQALPTGWADAVHPDDRARTGAAGEDARSQGLPYEIEVRYRRRDGVYRWHLARAEPLRDESGRVTAWFGTSTDIHDRVMAEAALRDLNTSLEARVSVEVAEREKAQAALLQAQKMESIGQLTGGVAHDFNNLLQALSGCLNLVGRRVKDPAIEPLLDAGRQAVDRGGKLTKQLMAFARQQALRPEPIDVRDAVLGMSELLARALRADIALEVDLESGLWPIEVDPTQFEMAMLNLAVNARDAMPAGGSLRIRGRGRILAPGDHALGLAGEFVEIAVADTGSGMSPEVLDRAFEPFFTTKEIGKGSGLGLAQIYGFARQSGGAARIESALGKGTTVALLLPRSRGVPTSSPPEQAASEAAGGRILMVEDDPIVGGMMAAALTDLGYSVLRATTADEALALVASGAKVDLLFTDVVMPGERNGLDLARELRRRRPDLPVVLTTGYSEGMAANEGLRVLAKPYRIEELVEALEAALGRPKSRVRARS